jgi:serine/threonine protein kinase
VRADDAPARQWTIVQSLTLSHYTPAGLYNRQPVAIKYVSNAIAAHERGRRMFDREIALTTTLRHPYLVSGFGCMIDSANPTRASNSKGLVLEYVPIDVVDCTRHSAPADMRAPRSVRVLWAAQVCSALAYLHSRGVLHCDLKPLNVMVARDGTARLMDLGTAKIDRTTPGAIGLPAIAGDGAAAMVMEEHGYDTVTGTGAFIGTALYAPPSLLEGLWRLRVEGAPSSILHTESISASRIVVAVATPSESRDAVRFSFSKSTDVYSLACTIVEIVTGVPPWASIDPARSVRTEADILRLRGLSMVPFSEGVLDTFRDITRATMGSSPGVDRIVPLLLSALSGDAERCPTAATLADALNPAHWGALHAESSVTREQEAHAVAADFCGVFMATAHAVSRIDERGKRALATLPLATWGLQSLAAVADPSIRPPPAPAPGPPAPAPAPVAAAVAAGGDAASHVPLSEVALGLFASVGGTARGPGQAPTPPGRIW